MLGSAGVGRSLVDPFNLKCVLPGRTHVALDSGAYHAFKHKLSLEYRLAIVRDHSPFDFAVALDIIGNAICYFN